MRLAEIDGLRAIAMTMVVAQHCHLLPFGWIGVWLFFVISGYVITLGFVSGEYPGQGFAQQFGVFMRRRAVRIVPVYLLYIAACALVLTAIGRLGVLGDLPYLLSFSFNWHMIFGFWPGPSDWGPFAHLWTLSVEQQFYLLFPLLALGSPRRWQLGAMAALVAVGPLVRWGWSQGALNHGGDVGWLAFSVYAASICHFDAFLIGALVARLEPRLRESPRASRALWLIAIVVAIGYAATYVGINRQLGAQGVDLLRNVFSGNLFGQGREVFVYVAVDLLAVAALVHALLHRPGSAWLGWAPLAWVGRVSYGGYLFHALVLWAFGQILGLNLKALPVPERLLVFAAAWAATVTLASLSFKYFELPLARRWRQAGASRTSTGATVQAVRA